jgi:hypothetical protein
MSLRSTLASCVLLVGLFQTSCTVSVAQTPTAICQPKVTEPVVVRGRWLPMPVGGVGQRIADV